MKTIIINENVESKLINNILKETLYGFSDKVNLIKNYLDKTYVKADISGLDKLGDISNTNIVIMLDSNGMPTEHRLTLEQLFEKLQFKYQNIFLNKDERDNFLKQLVNDWYFNRISKSGNLSNYY